MTRPRKAGGGTRFVPVQTGFGVLSDDPVEVVAARVAKAAIAGGAAPSDVALVMAFAETLMPAMAATARIGKEVAQLVEARRRQLNALATKNATVTDAQRKQVEAANAELERKFPIKAQRYCEIARRVHLKSDRVRYIIEGPRRRT